MRIAIITGERLHHKQLCARLAEGADVRAIIHPAAADHGLPGKLAKFRKDVTDCGLIHASLRAASRFPSAVTGWNAKSDYEQAEVDAFEWAESAYEQLDPRLIHGGIDPNSPTAIKILATADVDLVLTLGGPVYRPALINAAKLMLNFHTGVSPIYNGASTIDFAFANGHPHLCGGTLMVTSPVVDGGDILAHYLPSIDGSDTPATLFMKTVGAVPMVVQRLLTFLDDEASYAKCRQTRPLFYYKSRDWTLYQSQSVRSHLRRATTARYAREEAMHEYWRASTDEEAEQQVQETVMNLVLVK